MIVPGRTNIGVQQIDAPNAHPAIIPMGNSADMKILIVGGMSSEAVLAAQIFSMNAGFGVDWAIDRAREVIAKSAAAPALPPQAPTIQTR